MNDQPWRTVRPGGRVPTRQELIDAIGAQLCCHAGKDGDCTWRPCPQLRDEEPKATGRDCPLLDATELFGGTT